MWQDVHDTKFKKIKNILSNTICVLKSVFIF